MALRTKSTLFRKWTLVNSFFILSSMKYHLNFIYHFFDFSFWQKNVHVNYWEAECFKIDAKNKKVHCRSNLSSNLNEKGEIIMEYDYLVIGIGARSNTFNIPGVAENCHFLKVTSSGFSP